MGVASFELPQYVSSQTVLLDSIIQNGYAFEDRYDMAMRARTINMVL